MSGYYSPNCRLCGLHRAICICWREPVEPGGEGAQWLEARKREREARAVSPPAPPPGEAP